MRSRYHAKYKCSCVVLFSWIKLNNANLLLILLWFIDMNDSSWHSMELKIAKQNKQLAHEENSQID